MERTESRINQSVREHLSKYQEDSVANAKKIDAEIIKFDKKINDYRSQVLWRVKDCEELLKGRVATQELNDKVRDLETRINSRIKFENDSLHDRLMKVFETCQNRIKTAENFTKDKYMELTNYMKEVELKAGAMATVEMIDQIYDA